MVLPGSIPSQDATLIDAWAIIYLIFHRELQLSVQQCKKVKNKVEMKKQRVTTSFKLNGLCKLNEPFVSRFCSHENSVSYTFEAFKCSVADRLSDVSIHVAILIPFAAQVTREPVKQ